MDVLVPKRKVRERNRLNTGVKNSLYCLLGKLQTNCWQGAWDTEGPENLSIPSLPGDQATPPTLAPEERASGDRGPRNRKCSFYRDRVHVACATEPLPMGQGLYLERCNGFSFSELCHKWKEGGALLAR